MFEILETLGIIILIVAFFKIFIIREKKPRQKEK